MKNRVIRQILGGMFVVALGTVPAGTALAAPVSGVFGEMSGTTTAVQTTASKTTAVADTELVPTSMKTEKPAASTESLNDINTELATEALNKTAETTTETKPVGNGATAGVMLAMANIMAEEAGQLAEPQSKEETSAADTKDLADTETEAESEAASEETEEETEAESASETESEVDAFFTEEDVEEFEHLGVAVVEDFVNVRSEATTESDVVGKLYKNNACDVLETTEDGSWYKIKSGDLEGYVSSDYVTVGDTALIKSAARRTAKVTTETLFVRQAPSQDTDIIGMVPDGEVLTVVDESHLYDWGWVGVSIEEGVGYVSVAYVELAMEYTYGETREAEEARIAKEEEERRAAEAAAASSQAAKSSSSSSGSSGGVVAPGSSTGSSVANYALQFVGNPYVYGGSSLTNGTDCSGFVMSVYAAYGVGLPHSSSALRSVGYAVDPGSMSPGDIVCYSGHVGICIGGGQIVHASTAATGIKVSTAYYRDILAVRRIF